ncbi:uncharacterized protein [Engystomops pustulosus]|uniref:uncharacterized protein isoform X1 n=1 Tax=Engystomops pustulosus TaxID=76066 RepID=UPI003AFA7F62
MDKGHFKSLGLRYITAWLQHRIPQTSPYEIYATFTFHVTYIPQFNMARSNFSFVFWSDYTCSTGSRENRFLLFSFFGKETERHKPTNHQPERSQRVYRLPKIQDGVGKISHTHYSPRCINVHYRLKGCILSHPYTPFLTKVFKVFCLVSRGCYTTLSILCTPFWNIICTKDLYKGDGRGGGVSQTTGRTDRPVPRRPAYCWPRQGELTLLQRSHPRNLKKTGMDSKLPEVRTFPSYCEEIPGCKPELSLPNVVPSTGQGRPHQGSDNKIQEKISDLYQRSYEDSGLSNSLHLLGSLVSGPFQNTPGMDLKILEQETGGSGQENPNPTCRQGGPAMVVGRRESEERDLLVKQPLHPNPDRREPEGLGGSDASAIFPGYLDRGNNKKVLKFPRVASSMGSTQREHASSCPPTPPNSIRQYNYGLLHKKTRRNQVSSPEYPSSENIFVGRTTHSVNICHSSKGHGEFKGGLSKQKKDPTKRVEPQGGDLPAANIFVGLSSSGLVRNKGEYQVPALFFSGKRGEQGTAGRLLSLLGHSTSLRLPPNSPDRQGPEENISGKYQSHLHLPELAEEKLVPTLEEDVTRESSHSSAIRGPTTSGSNPSSKPREITAVCLDPESSFLSSQGLSSEVIKTLKASRKPVTFAIYHKIWKRFCSFCKDSPPSQANLNILQVLEFLQKGLELGLSTSTLKVQVSALSAFFDQPLIEHRWVKRFIKAASRLKPQTVKKSSAWDLTLVLNALMKEPFEPIDSSSVKNLTLKTVFLIAITSARRLGELQAISIREPYMKILDDRIVLMSDPNFVPKVVSDFHRNQEIILPSFCENPSSAREREWSSLDGKSKGRKASKATIARWLRLAIASCYDLQKSPIPAGIRAHSTRAMSTSWAERRGASLDQICRAATWSSSTTFSKHYRLDLHLSKDLSFGRKVLQAVIPP